MKSFKETVRKIGPWVVTAGLVGWIAGTTDFQAFRAAIVLADFTTFSLLAIVFAAVHLVLDSTGLHMLLERTGIGIPFRRLLAIRASSYLLGFINYNLAFVLIAAAAARGRTVRWQSLASPFIALNVIDLFVVSGILIGGLGSGSGVHLQAGAQSLLASGAVIGLMCLPLAMAAATYKSTRRTPGRAAGLLDTFRSSGPVGIAAVLGLRAILLASDMTGDFLMLGTFNLDIPVGVFMQLFAVDSFACVLPITVAGIGPTMVLMRVFFEPYVTLAGGSIAAIDAFSASATSSLAIIRTVTALSCMPFALKTGLSRSTMEHRKKS